MKLNFTWLQKMTSRRWGKKDSRAAEDYSAHLITEKSSTRVLEAYRMARTNLFYTGDGGKGGTVYGVTSASPADGKSLTCANLAISFAMSGKRVLIVDCDMRKPAQKKAFGASSESGLSEYLAGVVEAPEILPTSYENLSLLTSGRCPPNPAELLYRARFAELISKAKEEYDYVFVDLPPVGLISDATVVAPHIQAYIIVVRMNMSDYHTLEATCESVEKVGGKIAGFVLNDIDGGSHRYGARYGKYGKYYRYGKYGEYYSSYERYGKNAAHEPTKDVTDAEAAEQIPAAPLPQDETADTCATSKNEAAE